MINFCLNWISMKLGLLIPWSLYVLVFSANPRQGFPRLSPQPLGKIIGGTDALPAEFPYQLTLQDGINARQLTLQDGTINARQLTLQDGNNLPNFPFCGAVIYNPTTAITAAHCIYGEDYDKPKDLFVVAGERHLSEDDGSEQKRQVVKIIKNDKFSFSSLRNDIALLKFSEPFEFNEYVKNITLPKKGQSFEGLKCVVTGWGSLKSGGDKSKILQKVQVPIVSDEACSEAYGSSKILESMICAGEAMKDGCQGDSGGPLQCQNHLVGIVSWGYGCGHKKYPGVYTEVSYFTEWIEENANKI